MPGKLNKMPIILSPSISGLQTSSFPDMIAGAKFSLIPLTFDNSFLITRFVSHVENVTPGILCLSTTVHRAMNERNLTK